MDSSTLKLRLDPLLFYLLSGAAEIPSRDTCNVAGCRRLRQRATSFATGVLPAFKNKIIKAP